MFKKILLIPIAIVVAGAIIAGAIIYTHQTEGPEQLPSDQTQTQEGGQNEPSAETPQTYDKTVLENLAKCLTEKGFKFYGASWCGWCQKQKELFGEAAQYLPYVECIDQTTNQLTSECQEAGIEAFPTWELPDGEKPPGFKPLGKLAELSGCQLK